MNKAKIKDHFFQEFEADYYKPLIALFSRNYYLLGLSFEYLKAGELWFSSSNKFSEQEVLE